MFRKLQYFGGDPFYVINLGLVILHISKFKVVLCKVYDFKLKRFN